ncbi:ABC transporter substrate-binding protein [Roseiarcus fermentans]|nr:ABC transporter substrate-binding protein [Roseiarcus fermentans]
MHRALANGRGPTRRAALAGALASVAAGAAGRAAAYSGEGLEILAAPTGASISLARVVEAGGLAAAAPGATLRPWRDPDELRAGIVSGKTQLFSTPTHVPANLANRGLPIRLLCLLGAGHLYVVTADERVASFKDLAGKPVLGFFRKDMPDLVFRACAKMEGLDPDKDIQLSYVQSGMEAAQFLAAGKAATAILSEPPATAAIVMAARQDRILRRAISLQDVWSRHRHSHGVPMVGVAVRAGVFDQAPGLLAALRDGLPQAKDWALANPGEAGALAEKALQMRAPIFEKALPFMNLDIRSARAAKADLVDFYETIVAVSPDALAGRVPPDDFFLEL